MSSVPAEFLPKMKKVAAEFLTKMKITQVQQSGEMHEKIYGADRNKMGWGNILPATVYCECDPLCSKMLTANQQLSAKQALVYLDFKMHEFIEDQENDENSLQCPHRPPTPVMLMYFNFKNIDKLSKSKRSRLESVHHRNV